MDNNIKVALSEKRVHAITWTLLGVLPIIGMAVDLIAPSLPAIANHLNVSSEIAKAVIAIYLSGYALGNFFTGFLTDAWGRQKLLRLSLFSFIIVSILPIIFPHITVLLLARFLQGIMLGAVAVLARAIFSDILPAEKLVRLGTLMGTMWGLGPVLGPIIGGYLQYYLNWQAGFGFFSLAGVSALIAVYFIVPETHLTQHPLNFKTIKNNFLEVIRHRVFMGIVILMGLVYSLIIIFNTAGPFLIQTEMHYSPLFFGRLALVLGLFFLAATFASRYLLKKYQVKQLYFTVINLFFVIILLGVMMSYLFANSIILVSIFSAFMFFTCGMIFPMSMGKNLSLFRHIAGTAAATMYLINMLITSLTGFVMSFINVHNAISLMWTYFILMLLCVIVYRVIVSPKLE